MKVNLKYGVEHDETSETCTAGAGTLILEFGTLSRLTKDPTFEVIITVIKGYSLLKCEAIVVNL
jgi:hypothetical protein